MHDTGKSYPEAFYPKLPLLWAVNTGTITLLIFRH